MEKILVQLTAVFFLAYGLMFTLYPVFFSNLVTDNNPATTSGLIDMRATYGGMSIAVGFMMFVLARNSSTLKLGLLSVITVLLGMASSRLLGIIVDGSPNNLMFIYLIAEIVPSLIAIVLYRRISHEHKAAD
ncbi:MAG: DUF4345 domain-containing protein [Pseudomonadales bacterium]